MPVKIHKNKGLSACAKRPCFALTLLLIVPAYLLLVKIDYILMDKNIYIDFGHANLGLVLLMLFCYVNGVAILAVAVYKRDKIA